MNAENTLHYLRLLVGYEFMALNILGVVDDVPV